ncbi:MAG: serine/threonine protein kinase [Deltaproteobacteria bacterium]|nr:serine/threonine protein kinase [Deltaproteobacteria bacterium]
MDRWSTLSVEESRRYLQARLIVFSSLMFWSFVAFLAYISILYVVYPSLEPKHNRIILIGAGCGLTLLAVSWRLVLVRGTPTLAVLNWIDAFYALGTGTCFAFGAYLATDLKPAPYSCLLFTALMALTRAIMVPSSGKRTAFLALLAFAPFLVAGAGLALGEWKDLPGPAIFFSLVLVCAVVVSLATTGSKILYGLRQRVSAATQLGQYTLERKIGEGGMGAVYLARHVLLKRPTAIKLLLPDLVGADTVDRFEREVQHMSQLTHPNTVAVFDYGRSFDGVFYYAMEYLDGVDLEHLVHDFGPLPADRVVSILIQVCGAINEAHANGIIHRDIKPANIILCERGRVADVAKVVDYGLVKKISTNDSRDQAMLSRTALTIDSQTILGTPGYLAPEAVRDPQNIGRSVDLYSIGAVGYYLLTGKRLFEGETAMAICVQHLTGTPVPPSQCTATKIPAELEAIILSCVAQDAADRPPDAARLARLLREVPPTGDWDDARALAWWAEFEQRKAPPMASASLTIEIDLGQRNRTA